MIVGVHRDDNWEDNYADGWIAALQARGAQVRIVDLLRRDLVEQVAGCDGVMWRWGHLEQERQSSKKILYTVEHHLGIPVFPNSETSWHYDDKGAQWYLLQALSVPTPETWIFWREEEALSWAGSALYPVVFKLAVGAGASNVLKVEREEEARKLIQRMFRCGIFPMTMNEYAPQDAFSARALRARAVAASRYLFRNVYPSLAPLIPWWKPEHGYVLFQEFLRGNDFDTRVTVIGDRAFAFRRWNRPDDFRASGSGRIDFDPDGIDVRCLEMAFDASRRGRFQSMAYDFLYRGGEPVISEISYTFSASAVACCPGHWDAELNWHEGAMRPEEAQADDFLRFLKGRAA